MTASEKLTVADALKKSADFLDSGEITNADRLLTHLLHTYPKQADANFLMGTLAAQLGKFQESLPYFKTALESNPTDGRYWISYIDTLITTGHLEEAGLVIQQAKSRGANSDAMNRLIMTLQELETAVSSQDTSKEPSKQLFEQVDNLYKKGKLVEATNRIERLLEYFPSSLNLYLLLGACQFDSAKYDSAISSYEQATKIAPRFAEGYSNLGVVLKAHNDTQAAIKCFKKAIAINPKSSQTYYNLGQAYRIQNAMNAAINSFGQAIRISPNFSEAYFQRGATLEAMGDTSGAEADFRRAIEIDPKKTSPFYSLSRLKFAENDDDLIGQLRSLKSDESLSITQKIPIHFALGEIYEKLGYLEQSFSDFTIGNSLCKQLSKYQISEDIRKFAKIKESFAPIAKLAAAQKMDTSSLAPIFILGMPRSGTSLVEQIVTSHSGVDGAGELNFINYFGASIVENAHLAKSSDLLRFREIYLRRLSDYSTHSAWITDKMPHNFRYIGLICCAFPEAKIIRVNREPAATCWSNFKTFFQGSDLGYTNDLNDLVQYYQLYEDLMSYWQQLLPNKIYTLDYDNLTTRQPEEIHSLLDYLELDFEESCLSPHENRKIVKTASSIQVREPIYQNSSRQWRKFEPFLNGAFDRLDNSSQ